MLMVLEVDRPGASCAYWDEKVAKWSEDGVATVATMATWPPSIACTTRHLSIFGGILSTIVGNIVLALQLARQSLRFFNCPRSVSS
jgi:hypothetical protein